MTYLKLMLCEGLADIRSALVMHQQFTVIGWKDVAERYRRSKIGAFWLTINMAVMIGALGFIFGQLFNQPVSELIPFLTIGQILWGLITSNIIEGSTCFVSSRDTILQIKMPLFTHVARTLWRNIIILGHNFLILPIVFIVFLNPLNWSAILAPLGLLLMILNLGWVMLLVSIVGTRFRDATQIIQNLLQVSFYLTPIIWNPSMLSKRAESTVLVFNPFYHMIELVRAPLLGKIPSINSWFIVIMMTFLGWFLAIAFFGAYRKRIPYWL